MNTSSNIAFTWYNSNESALTEFIWNTDNLIEARFYIRKMYNSHRLSSLRVDKVLFAYNTSKGNVPFCQHCGSAVVSGEDYVRTTFTRHWFGHSDYNENYHAACFRQQITNAIAFTADVIKEYEQTGTFYADREEMRRNKVELLYWLIQYMLTYKSLVYLFL